MWDAIVEFFTGSSSGATAEAIEAGTTGFAGAGMEAAVLGADAYSFSDWFGSLFEAENVGTAQSVLEASGDSSGAAEGVSKLATEAPGTTSRAERVLTAEPTIEEATKTKLPAEQGAIAKWWSDLDPKSKAEIFKTVGGGALAGLGAMGAASIKGGQEKELLDRRYELEAELMQKKQAMNKVPAGVPFKPKKGALLTNQMGQPVYNPNNPLKPRPGLIYGGMNGG